MVYQGVATPYTSYDPVVNKFQSKGTGGRDERGKRAQEQGEDIARNLSSLTNVADLFMFKGKTGQGVYNGEDSNPTEGSDSAEHHPEITPDRTIDTHA